MTTTLAPAPVGLPIPPPLPAATVADFLERLGDVSARRVRMTPTPGTATEQDLLAVNARDDVLCELIDGVLVEKPVASRESLLAAEIARLIGNYNKPRRLGHVLGADGTLRLIAGRVRLPDVSFLSWNRFPGRKVPTDRVWALAPDLAVEVLSESNTLREMAIKRREYFAAGTTIVWQIDPEARTAEVFTAPEVSTAFDASGVLDGGTVLPGFALSLTDLFRELDE